MNDDRFEQLLADYVAGELTPADEAEFRAELDRSPQRCELAHSLQATAAALETDVPDLDQAAGHSAELSFERVALRRLSAGVQYPARRTGALAGPLRYAAVILLAFATGYLVRDWRSAPAASVPASPPPRAAAIPSPAINDQYLSNYARAARAFPHSTSFSRALLAVARRGH